MQDKSPQPRYKLPESRGTLINSSLPGFRGSVAMERVMDIPVDAIGPSPHQTRKNIDLDNPDIIEMAENIERVGLINPIVVRPNPEPDNPKWILVAGERRLAAHKRLGRKTIKANIREALKEDEVKSWSITLSENVIRRQLRSDEAGKAIELAKKLNLSNEEIANRIGVTERRVMQFHGTLKLPQDLRKKLDEHEKLTRRHIEAFQKIIGPQKITEMSHQDKDTEEISKTKSLLLELLDATITEDLTGEETINRAKELLKPQNKSFLTNINKKLREAIKRKPTKISQEKRQLVINQAKQMIEVLSKLVQEETEKLRH